MSRLSCKALHLVLSVRSFSVELKLQLAAGVDVPRVVVLLSFPPDFSTLSRKGDGGLEGLVR